MQTKPETEVGTLSGARQVPLMRADQIVPGVIFTGIAADHVHEVVSVAGTRMTTRFLPERAQEAGHIHAFTLHNNASCRCGMNQYDIQPFLPEDNNAPKVHILVPVGPVVPITPYTIYLLMGPNGALVVRASNMMGIHPAPTTDTEVPVIARGVRVWSLPDEAQQLMRDDDEEPSPVDD